MMAQLKVWISTVGGLLLTLFTLGGYAKYQKRRADKAEDESKQLRADKAAQQKVINNVKTRQKIREDNATASRGELAGRLSDDGYFRD